MQSRDQERRQKRNGWLVTIAAIALGAATLPIPDGMARWLIIAAILAGWLVGMRLVGDLGTRPRR